MGVVENERNRSKWQPDGWNADERRINGDKTP
jgi:hypothetical protein